MGEGEGGEAWPEGGSGRELPRIRRKAKFTGVPLAKSGGEINCWGFLWMLKTGDAGQSYCVHRVLVNLGLNHKEL